MYFLLMFLCLLVYLPNIRSDCVIEYPRNADTVPKYKKYVGSFKLKIPFNSKSIKLFENEKIEGVCETYFSPIQYQIKRIGEYDYRYGIRETTITESLSNQSSIVLQCRNNKLILSQKELLPQVFSCMALSWNIYSAKNPYSWCKSIQNSDTFLLAAQPKLDKYLLAAICYNMDQISLQTLVYNTTTLQRNYLNQQSTISSEDLGEDLWNFKTTTVSDLSNESKKQITLEQKLGILTPSKSGEKAVDIERNLELAPSSLKSICCSSDADKIKKFVETRTSLQLKVIQNEERLQETLSKLSKTDGWLALANYEISSIVQDELLEKYFNEYKNILNIVWWHNLRIGNWRRFQSTLQDHARNNNYKLYMGTSGIVQYPTDNKCDKELSQLELKLGFKNETVPAYIWTYLKSYENLNKEFVIVGYNSPYTEYFGLEKIIFCPDICSEIPWLNEVSQSFRYVNAGIMFCCSTDFIRQTNYLQGFPMEVLKAPTIEPVDETTTEEALEFNTNINVIQIDK